MIKEPGTFISKMEAALNARNYKFGHGFVDYYDKYSLNGKVGLFEKPKEFEYQKEFRFSIENGLNEPIILNIGNMESYSQVFNTQDIVKGLKLEVTNITKIFIKK